MFSRLPLDFLTFLMENSAYDPHWIRKILASKIRIKKCGSKGQDINQELQKNVLLSNLKSEQLKKKIDIKTFWFQNGWLSFIIKISERNWTKKNENSSLVKNSVNFKEITWIRIRIHFFQCWSRIRIWIHIKIKRILSTYGKYENVVFIIKNPRNFRNEYFQK